MKFEYLIFNLSVLAAPILLSFDRRVFFFKKWRTAVASSLLVAPGFLLWDIMATGRHWWFNDQFTLNFRLFGLPPGEWLFFVSIPFACIFIWEVLKRYLSDRRINWGSGIRFFIIILMPFSIIFFLNNKEYTGIIIIALGIAGIADKILQTDIFENANTYFISIIILFLTLVFNGYLTARPVVLYDISHQIGFKILTVPLEDFFYGLALILLNIIVFEKLEKGKNG